MFKLIVENKAGMKFDLTNERTLNIISVDGITPLRLTLSHMRLQ